MIYITPHTPDRHAQSIQQDPKLFFLSLCLWKKDLEFAESPGCSLVLHHTEDVESNSLGQWSALA